MKTYKDKISEIDKLIPDKNVQSVIFNFGQNYSSFLSDEKRCLTYFSNLLIFTAIVVLNAFLNWKTNKDDKAECLNYSNSFIRIYNMLNRSYDSIKFNCDFIDDLIINLEIDCLLATDIQNSFVKIIGISNFFAFSHSNNNLSKYIYMLKQKRISSKYNSCFGFDELVECIKMFPYLSFSTAEFYQNNVFSKEINGIELKAKSIDSLMSLNLNYSICTRKNCMYYMEDFSIYDPKKIEDDKNKCQILQINYGSFDSSDSFNLTLADKLNEKLVNEKYYAVSDTIIEDFLIYYDIVDNSINKGSDVFFKDYLYLNNGYIKFLSLSVSDTISSDTKKAILKRYKTKYNDFFERMYVVSLFTDKREIGYRWDEIVLFLFLEEGIYDFLCFLLSKEKYKNFVLAFKRRFDKKKIDEIINTDKFISNIERDIQYISENNKKDCQAKALIILASKLFAFHEWNFEKNYYPVTIDDTIKELTRVYNSRIWEDREKILYFLNASIQVLIFVFTFYTGIIEYSKEKKNYEIKKEDSYYSYNISSFKYSDNNDYVRNRKLWETKMSKRIIKTRHANDFYNVKLDINLNTHEDFLVAASMISNAFIKLINFNNTLSKRKNPDNEVLFYTLGKRKLFNSEDMYYFKDCILNAINKSFDNNNILKDLYNASLSFFNYLKTGTKNNTSNESYIKNAIYPIVGQYYNQVTSRDGYHYSFFKINCNDYNYKDYNDVDQLCIKMITDDIFDFGCSYYCIPNINMIANTNSNKANCIWGNPIIVPCSLFTSQTPLETEILDNQKDYEEAVELIYQSDEFVYSKLFGSMKNAKIIMPLLFENPNSKFYKKFYHILKKNNQVVAIVALYNSTHYNSGYNHQWNTSLIKNTFSSYNIELPSDFDIAIKYLEYISNDFISSNYYFIDDLCVRKEYRNKGVGKSLLMDLIRHSSEDDCGMMLTVYKDNTIAQQLYSSVGFIPYAKDTDGYNCLSKEYYKMIKI